MKVLNILILTVLLGSCNSKKDIIQTAVSEHDSEKYAKKSEVINLDSINNVYVVYVIRNDSVFKIASLKEELNNCNKIKISQSYNLLLHSYLRKGSQKLDIRGVRVDENTIVELESKNQVIWDLFWTDNLKGLCWSVIPDENEE